MTAWIELCPFLSEDSCPDSLKVIRPEIRRQIKLIQSERHCVCTADATVSHVHISHSKVIDYTSVCPHNITPWLIEPWGSMPHSQGHSNNPYPEPNQPNSSYWWSPGIYLTDDENPGKPQLGETIHRIKWGPLSPKEISRIAQYARERRKVFIDRLEKKMFIQKHTLKAMTCDIPSWKEIWFPNI